MHYNKITRTLKNLKHVLLDSASPVLTATGFLDGKLWQFSTHYTIDIPQPITKNLSQLITLASPMYVPNLVHIRPRGLLGEWVKYGPVFYLCLFSGIYLQVRPVDGFSCMMAQTTRTSARMCLFGFRWYGSPFRGSNPPQKNIFGAWIGVFQPNWRNRKTYVIPVRVTGICRTGKWRTKSQGWKMQDWKTTDYNGHDAVNNSD